MQILNILFLVTLTTSQAAISPDGRCGKLNLGYSCLRTAFGDCCSSYGFCGSLDEFCGKGCDPAYGSCKRSHSIIPTASGASPTGTTASKVTPCSAIQTGEVYKKCMASEAIRCYELPYGALGFLSDVLTIYTVIMLARGYSPWFPKRELNGKRFDIFLGIASILGTSISVIHTIFRCSRGTHWSFILLGAWRGLLSMSLGSMTIHAGITHNFHSIGRWLIFYSLGLTLGIAGLSYISFVSPGRDYPHSTPFVLMIIAIVLGGFTALVCGWWKLLWIFGKDRWISKTDNWPWIPFAIYYAMTFGVFMALASDWILASIADNFSGVPSKDQAPFYWIYFVFKRLPSFSI